MSSPLLRNARRRSVTVLGAAALGVGAFALPAAAQTPQPTETVAEDPSPTASGGEPETFAEQPSPNFPYLQGDAVFTGVAPGGGVELRPEFLQEWAFPEDVAAVVVSFSQSQEPFDGGRGADAFADYDNCVDRYFDDPGVSCVITDFEDSPGTVFEATGPVGYTVNATAPGPVNVCVCHYSARVVDAAELEQQFGDLDWDTGTDDQFGLRVAEDPGPVHDYSSSGTIVIETADNPWDLAVGDVDVKGDKGTEHDVEVAVTNGGPADAYYFYDGPVRGSYALFGTLPAGLELVSIEEDGWVCLDEADRWPNMPEQDPDELAKLDFVCVFTEILVGQTHRLPLRVEITGTGASGGGTLEIVALDDDGDPGVLEADPADNTAAFTVDANGSGRLPTTGSPLVLVFGASAIAVLSGAVLYVLTRRRKGAGGTAR